MKSSLPLPIPTQIAAASYMTDRISVGGSEELVDALECDVYDQIKVVGLLKNTDGSRSGVIPACP